MGLPFRGAARRRVQRPGGAERGQGQPPRPRAGRGTWTGPTRAEQDQVQVQPPDRGPRHAPREARTWRGRDGRNGTGARLTPPRAHRRGAVREVASSGARTGHDEGSREAVKGQPQAPHERTPRSQGEASAAGQTMGHHEGRGPRLRSTVTSSSKNAAPWPGRTADATAPFFLPSFSTIKMPPSKDTSSNSSGFAARGWFKVPGARCKVPGQGPRPGVQGPRSRTHVSGSRVQGSGSRAEVQG